MKQRKISFNKLMENRNFMRIFSIVIAIFCWLVVVFTISSEIDDIKRDVPVDLDMHSNTLAALGLNVIEVSTPTVTANVRGERAVVGGLKPEDLTATVRLTNVTGPRTYDLEVVSLSTSREGYEILSYSPSRISVRFDRLVTETFVIEPIVNGLSTAQDFTFDGEIVTPDTVAITGPQVELNKIARCAVAIDLNEPLTGTYSTEVPITLYDVQGNEIDLEERHLSLDQTSAQLVVRVLKNKDLALDVEFINEPRGFNLEELSYSISNSGVMVAGPVDVIDRYREIVVGVIDMKGLTPSNSTYVFDVEMPTADFVNLDNINSLEVVFDSKEWEEATFNVDNILLLNPPSKHEVSLLNDSPLYNVTFVGSAEMLELMSADDIVAEVDLSEKDYPAGQHRAPVKLSAPNRGMVWPVGDYSVIIQVEEQE